MKYFLKALSLSSCLSLSTWAGGVMLIKGNISGCDKFVCKVKIGPQLYKIDLAALTTEQSKIFLTKKSGDFVNLSVPMRAIKDVTDIK